MLEQEARIEQLEKEVEILKKRVDYFYEEIRPYIMKYKCKNQYVVADEKGVGHICYEKQECFDCKYASINEPHKVVYPLGASYRQYDNRTPNELFSDTVWEYRGKIQGVPMWVRIK